MSEQQRVERSPVLVMSVLMLLAVVAFAFFTFMSLFVLGQDGGVSFLAFSSWCCACTIVLFQCVRHLYRLYRQQKSLPGP